MISKFVREQKQYTKKNLKEIFECQEEDCLRIISRLKEYSVLKIVKSSENQKNMSDLVDEKIKIINEENIEKNHLYVFSFVGIIIIEGIVLKCYPKYIHKNDKPIEDLKQIIKVLEKYNSKEQIIQSYEKEEEAKFNRLAYMVYLIKDYYENGLYTNMQDVIEINGNGEILWDKTINESFSFINKNRPIYLELKTRKRKNNDSDYCKRLHETILSVCSKELKEADLLDLLGIQELCLSDNEIEDFGDTDFILYRLNSEMNTQYSTRKQEILKLLRLFIEQKGYLKDINLFSVFGTNSFNQVWENVCADVMDNQLKRPLGMLELPVQLKSEYASNDSLISLIDKPIWIGYGDKHSEFEKKADETLRPDFVAVKKVKDKYGFIIVDAKYYVIQLEPDKVLRGQPGVGDITKQYLYQLAYQKFVEDHKIDFVKNIFVIPGEDEEIIEKGYVKIDMLDNLELEKIQIRQLPAKKIFKYYLSGEKMDIEILKL